MTDSVNQQTPNPQTDEANAEPVSRFNRFDNPWFNPKLMWGAGITQGTHEEVVDARRVASTLSALLGVPRPIDARLPPLPGARSTRTR